LSTYCIGLFYPVHGGKIHDIQGGVELIAAHVLLHGDKGSGVLDIDICGLLGQNGLAPLEKRGLLRLIDGGQGQMSAVRAILDELGIRDCVTAIGKVEL
jgi:hypothetical protein